MPLLLILGLMTANAGNSQLWGEQGELWDPLGRLPDFSYAGYGQGETSVPSVPIVNNVTKFGAVGDGLTDDTAAFQQAIDETSHGTLLIPQGTYRIEGQIQISKSQIMLRGEGPDQSILFFPNSLEDLFGPADQWSWNGGLIHIEPPESSSEITTITADALRGDISVLANEPDLLVGADMVMLHLTDDSAGSLGRHLYAEQADGGDCTWQNPLTLTIPLRIESVRGDAVHFTQPLRHDIRSSWNPVLLSYPSIDHVGIESLRIRFPDTPYAGHLNEPGYNGIFMTDGVVNSWVKDVTIENSDNGVLTDKYSKWITVDGLQLEGREGHHGLNIAHTADSMFMNLHFKNNWRHAMTVDHRSNGNVFKKVTSDGIELEMDHHRDSPFENLFTNIDAPTNLINGGSSCAGYPGGARNTFWGHKEPLVPPYWQHIQTNLIGPTTVAASLTEQREWIEPVDDLLPRDLHKAQLALRLGLEWEDTASATDSGGATDSGSDTALGGSDKAGPNNGCGCTTSPHTTETWAAWLLAVYLCTRRKRPQRSGAF